MLLLNAQEVRASLVGCESEILDAVAKAYREHYQGKSVLPQSVFLRPDGSHNRIIALPASLSSSHPLIGMKWVSSWPSNTSRGIPRASAVVVLNSPVDGRAVAILEGAQISAIRTAASASLAAKILATAGESLALIGCGPVNVNVLKYLRLAFPQMRRVSLYDIVEGRDRECALSHRSELEGLEVLYSADVEGALAGADIISFATTAQSPHIRNLANVSAGATILHISLRDLDPQLLRACLNYVDDADHVFQASTSLHLAEQSFTRNDLVRGHIGDLLSGQANIARNNGEVAVFHPFGLGILDLAVASIAVRRAGELQLGSQIPAFHD